MYLNIDYVLIIMGVILLCAVGYSMSVDTIVVAHYFMIETSLFMMVIGGWINWESRKDITNYSNGEIQNTCWKT